MRAIPRPRRATGRGFGRARRGAALTATPGHHLAAASAPSSRDPCLERVEPTLASMCRSVSTSKPHFSQTALIKKPKMALELSSFSGAGASPDVKIRHATAADRRALRRLGTQQRTTARERPLLGAPPRSGLSPFRRARSLALCAGTRARRRAAGAICARRRERWRRKRKRRACATPPSSRTRSSSRPACLASAAATALVPSRADDATPVRPAALERERSCGAARGGGEVRDPRPPRVFKARWPRG